MPASNQMHRPHTGSQRYRPRHRVFTMAWLLLSVLAAASFGSAQNAEPQIEEELKLPQAVKPIPLDIVDPELIPSIRKLQPGTVRIDGLEALSEDEAKKMITFQIRVIEESGITKARADDAAFFLEKGIRDLGYDAAEVNWEIEQDTNVILSVNEGESLTLGNVSVEGNENLSEEAVRELLTKVTRERLGYRIDAKDIPYVASDVDEGVKAVRHLYQLLGYHDATVEITDTSQQSESSTIDISLSVKEGNPLQVGKITFPETPIPKVNQIQESVLSEFSGKPFTEAVSANLSDRITTAANEAGYFQAETKVIASEPHRSKATDSSGSSLFVDLKVVFEPGEQFTLKSVEVSGTEKVRDGVIERRFRHLLDKPYSPIDTNKEVEKLLETGAFESLAVDPLPNLDDTISLSVAAEEAKRIRLAVYGGYGSYEGPIAGLEYRNSNFLGRLHTLEAKGEYTSRGLRGEFKHTDPWLFDSDWQSQLALSTLTNRHEGYDVFNTDLQFALQRKFGKREQHKIALFIKPEHGEITEFEIEEQFLGPSEYIVSQAGFIYSFGSEEDRLTRAKGFTADFILSGASSAIGSEIDFTTAALRASYILPIGSTKLRLGGRVGVIKPSGDDEIPIDLRLFSGGPRSVRSFRERDLGPHDKNGFPTGGEFATVFNLEYEIPVAGPISLAPFLDAGNLLPNAEDASLDEMHYAAGLGLIFNSPIGPLRVEYGHNLNKGEGEPSGSWHVGFGFSF